MANVSNWGATDANGVLELVLAEGEARLTARGLKPTPDVHYVLWISQQDTKQVYRLGELVARPDGIATLDLLLPDAIPGHGWDFAMVTAESTATPARPGPRRTIVGRFQPYSPVNLYPRAMPNTGLGGASVAVPSPRGDSGDTPEFLISGAG